MSDTRMVSVRLMGPLYAASKQAADGAGLTVGAWLRSLAERETGVPANPRPGLSGLPAEVAAKAGRKGSASRWRKKKESGK